jgi:hypothetical protein
VPGPTGLLILKENSPAAVRGLELANIAATFTLSLAL